MASDLERKAELDRYSILDTPAEEAFDRVVESARRVTGAQKSAITLVDVSRQWFKARIGLEASETPLDRSFCATAIRRPDEPTVVADASVHPEFRNNPAVWGDPPVRFYAGVPIRSTSGIALGTLCVFGEEPRALAPEQLRSLQDLASQVESELELRRRVKDLERIDREKVDLANLLVHDLKGPLTVILANTSFLRSESVSAEERVEILSDIDQAANSCVRMVLSLLDLAKAEDGKLAPQPLEVDIASFVAGLVRHFPDTTGTRARIESSIASDAQRVVVDPDLLHRILGNLVENALKFSPKSGKVRLVVATDATKSRAIWRVEDEGPGIPPEARVRIFEKYAQTDTGRAVRSGRGLGLTFCRAAAEAMGGSIHVDDRSGAGAAFVLTVGQIVP